MHLVDTNVWLERLLDQERAAEVEQFLRQVPSEQLYITDFALHSVGIALSRLGQIELFLSFIHDLLIEFSVHLIRLEPADLLDLPALMQRFFLDFDDGYQYAAAAKYGLTIVSFDTDFDRTEIGRKTPAQLLP